jgi:hypothetical protein
MSTFRTSLAPLAAVLALVGCGDEKPKIYGPVYDATPDGPPPRDGAVDPTDGAADASDAGTDATGCTSVTVLLGGSSAFAFGASRAGAGAFAVQNLSGTVKGRVGLAPLGGGFLAVVRAQSDALQYTSFSASWADPANVSTVTARDAPAVAASGAVGHAVYQASDYKFYRAGFVGGMWSPTAEPVGNPQSFGPNAPSAAMIGQELVIAQAGNDGNLYVQSYTGSWAAAVQVAGGALVNTIAPTLVALSGGAADLMVVFARSGDYKIMSATRSGGSWSTPALLDTNAFTNEPVALAALPGGRVVLVYRGSDMLPYWSLYTPGASPAWTAPLPLVTGTNPVVLSVPSVARGVCGADAVVAWAEAGGVRVSTLTGSSWSAPEPVNGTAGATDVAVGTR